MKKQLIVFYSAILATILLFTGLHANEELIASRKSGSGSGASWDGSSSNESSSSDSFLGDNCYDCNPITALSRKIPTMLDVKIERLNMALQMSMVTNPMKFGANNTAGLVFLGCVEDATCERWYDQIKITVDFAADYDWSKNTITDATNLEIMEDLYNCTVKLVHRHVEESIKEESIVVEIRQLQPHGIPPNSLVTWQNGYAYYEEAFYQIINR